jgi:hypothetical protein
MKDVQKLSEAELIDEINKFSKMAEEGSLSDEDVANREIYRKEYIKRVTGSLKAHLNHIKK